jgi:hypothetical protein
MNARVKSIRLVARSDPTQKTQMPTRVTTMFTRPLSLHGHVDIRDLFIDEVDNPNALMIK